MIMTGAMKMKTKIKYVFFLPLVLGFLMFPSCARDTVDEPSPFGPSSFALVFHISANPNVLYCTSQKPRSTIKASLNSNDGSPVSGTRIYFSIDGPGNFSGGKTKAHVTTDSNGKVSISYIGPTGNNLNADRDAWIRGHVETSTPYYIHREIFIRLIKAN
jgi:hypothetical protein